MHEIPPCTVSSYTPFEPYSYHLALNDNSENVFGHVSQDGSWAWVAQGAVLEVYSLNTKERCGLYCFAAKLKDRTLSITAIVELCSPHISFPCLIVGLDTSVEGGLLCVYNVKTSKVVRAIHLPHKITALEVVSGIGGATMETYTLCEQFRIFFGIVAVGTEGGHVLLVDLCLDSENYSDETVPNKSIVVHTRTHNLTSKRRLASTSNEHICVFLNDSCFNHGIFEYKNNRILLESFFTDDVIISALKYVRSLAVLVIGFNFGGIQLWSLQNMLLEISVPVQPTQQPLVYFAFQEPENDPRNFCYLWAIRGHYQSENYKPENSSTATLYSLAYAKKDWIPRYGFFYHTLQGCTKRFEFTFSDDLYMPLRRSTSSCCSRLIACDVISQGDVFSRLDMEDSIQSDEWGCAEDLSLCLMAWENWPVTEEKPSSSYLVLFDLNQWYQAQMPSILRCNSGDACSYMGVFCLREVMQKMGRDSLLAISVVPNSLRRFKSITAAEEMFFPSAFSFKIWCIAAEGLLQASYLGVQQQVLSRLSIMGPRVLIDPKDMYKKCLANGLLNHMSDVTATKQTPLPRQREILLTLALENNMVQFLVTCVQQSSEFIHAGWSSKFILDWLWKTVTQIKTSTDKFCQPLFNCSGQLLDEAVLVNLHNYKARLKHLSDVLAAFQNSVGPHTEQGRRELQLRKEVVDSIFIYLHILIWLYDCKLLPEHAEGDEYGEDEVAYPVTVFNKTYLYRRNELSKLNSSVRENEVLLVDGLVANFGESLVSMWESKGGTRAYPPPSIYAAVSSYLIEGVSLHKKHMLMYYLLLDMAAYLNDRQQHLFEKLLTFCTANNIDSSSNKLTQAFWHLDHQDFETAVSYLADPMISDSDITPEQHVRILKSLLFQGQAQKALKYINFRAPPERTDEEVKLHLSVLLANGLIADAFNYQRQHQSSANIDDLLNHIFLGCQQTHSLGTLLQLPLNPFESAALAKFLNTCADPRAPELLVLFHLLCSRPLEAAKLNDKLVTQVIERSSRNKERLAARNALVAGFLDVLPEEQKKLAQELNQICSHVEKREINSQPLSAAVTNSSLISISYSDLLTKVMEKMADSSYDSNVHPHTPFRSWMKSISTTPFLRSPFTPNNKKRKRISDVLRNEPDQFLPDQNEYTDITTPAKKSRTFEISSFKLTDTDKRKSKIQPRSEFLSLLQTPPVSRQTSRIPTPKVTESVPEITPLSILKTKSTEIPFSPAKEIYYARTPSVCSEMTNDEEMSEQEAEPVQKPQESGRQRQLRFQVPSPEELQNKHYRASPRRPVHEEPLTPVKESYSSCQKKDFYNIRTNVLEKHSLLDIEPTSEKIAVCQPVNKEFTLRLSESESNSSNISSHIPDTTDETKQQTSAFAEETEDRENVSIVEVVEIDSSSSSMDSYDEENSLISDIKKRTDVCLTSESASVIENKQLSVIQSVKEDSEHESSQSSSQYRENLLSMTVNEVKQYYQDASGLLHYDTNLTVTKSVPEEIFSPEENEVPMETNQLSESEPEHINPLTETRISPEKLFSVVQEALSSTERIESQEPLEQAEIDLDFISHVEEVKELEDIEMPLQTRARSRSSSPSRTQRKRVTDEVLTTQLLTITEGSSEKSQDLLEPQADEYVIPSNLEEDFPEKTENEEVPFTSDSYIITRTRSRSKSASPARERVTSSTVKVTSTLPSIADESPLEKEKLQDSQACLMDDSTVTSEDAQVPTMSMSTEPEKDFSISDSLVMTRARSRSKSASPSRVFGTRTVSKLPTITDENPSEREASDELQDHPMDILPSVSEDKEACAMPTHNGQAENVPDFQDGIVTRTRSRSKSLSPARISRSSTIKVISPNVSPLPVEILSEKQKPHGNQEKESSESISAAVVRQEIGETTPEGTDKVSSSTSPYMGTRSKSISPSRRGYRKSPEHTTKISPLKADIFPYSSTKEKQGEIQEPVIEQSENITPPRPDRLAKSKSIAEGYKAMKSSPSRTKPSPDSLTVSGSNNEQEIEKNKQTETDAAIAKTTETKTRGRPHSKKTVATSSAKGMSLRKKTVHDDVRKQLQFTFSEPHSPADPQILEALSATPSKPIPPFVFSPPASRTRARSKKTSSTDDSQTSGEEQTSKKAPVDPLLQDDSMQGLTKNILDESVARRPGRPRKTKNLNEASFSDSQEVINFISPGVVPESSQKSRRQLPSARHTMNLRRTRAKKKTVKLF